MKTDKKIRIKSILKKMTIKRTKLKKINEVYFSVLIDNQLKKQA